MTIPEVKTKKQAIKVKCPECGDTHSYHPTYTEYIGYIRYNTATDPFLGLELWYQAQFKDELFWAYNNEHLHYLEQYVVAKLRERNNPRYMTMVEKLPAFIKSAKNREGLLKLINKLKNKSLLKHTI
ncbi:hypothetical protein GXP67_25385 [Rhodocytophaga rosea]|uniref:Uncharacterized protein n=1 Tax=Rhodocytophaga rosea TaxID=2704465 RepID=A0A6C0GQ87_9BACT|nr:hypothetical protein [Rhodocytophaga rosea]QHT69742.1 hypothetical protein GXP67_25385 [Rhodocytophaga rosea]